MDQVQSTMDLEHVFLMPHPCQITCEIRKKTYASKAEAGKTELSPSDGLQTA